METTSKNEFVKKAVSVVDELYNQLAVRFGWEVEDKNVEVEGSDDHAVKMWEWMKSERLVLEGVELIRGNISGFYPHTWFRVAVPADKAGMPGMEWVVDVACPHVYPNTLVLHPDSPIRKLYMVTDVIDGAPLWIEGEGGE